MDIIEVAARSRSTAVAGAIAGVCREHGRAEVQAVGAGAVNQAIEAVIFARGYLALDGIDVICNPCFRRSNLGRTRTHRDQVGGRAAGCALAREGEVKGRTVNIYVGNLSFQSTEDELRQAFEVYGEVAPVAIIEDRDTGRSKGFGFVEMPDDGEAQEAIEGLDGTDLVGRTVTVNQARPHHTCPTARRGAGGWADVWKRGHFAWETGTR